MRDRMYGADGRALYSPPRRPTMRHFSPRRSRVEEKYPREDERSRRFDRKYGYDRDLSRTEVRLPDRMDGKRVFLDTVDRDSYVVGNRRSRSPRMIEKRDLVDGDHNLGGKRFYNYDAKDKYKYGAGVGSTERVYDDGLLRRGSTSTKFKLDHFSEGQMKSDGLNGRYDGGKDDNHGIGGSRFIRGEEKEFYPKNQYVDTNRTGLLSDSSLKFSGTEPFLSDYDKGRKVHSDLYSLGQEGNVGVARSYLNASDGSSQMASVTARYLTNDVDKQGYFHFRNENQLDIKGTGVRDLEKHYLKMKDEDFHFKDGLHLDKQGIVRPVGRDRNKKDDDLTSSKDFLKSDSENVSLSSRSKECVPMSSSIFNKSFTGYVEDIHLPSHGIQPGTGLVSDSLDFDGYVKKTRYTSPIGSGSRFDDIKSGSRLYSGLADEKCSDTLYHKYGTNIEPRDIVDQHGVVRMSRITPLDSADESSRLKLTDTNRLWEKHPTTSVFSKSTNSNSYRSMYPKNQELDELHSGISHLPYEREAYCRRRNVRPEEHNNGLHGSSRFLVERSDIFPMKDDISWGRHNGCQRKDDLVDLTSVDPYQRGRRDEYIADDMLYGHNIGIIISSDGTGARKIYNNLDARVDVDPAIFSKKRKLANYKHQKFREVTRHERSFSQISPSRLSAPNRSASRDIKKRLGPVPQKLHVSQRLLKKYKPSLRKRLGLVPQRQSTPSLKKKPKLPWLKNIDSSKVPSVLDDSNGDPNNRCEDNLEECVPLAGPEPPDKSEDFKQMVQIAFFKFLKQINETSGKRKQYMEHGKDGCLKCIVCGSNSDGFVDTESLVRHAFTFKKIGPRSQHLGLYKALCVLMGWVIADPSSDWHCEIMSNDEASALREDLIIWPPVIIFQNCSIDSKNFDTRILVSTETLDAKLRGMGIGGILKVSTGKPANQSVMIVTFNGTLSGLEDAEKLHQAYAEKGHGRADLKQHMCNKSDGGIQVVEEDVLYGYLGIAEDLGKLDFDIKKRCVVRSRKEMLSIANAC